MTYLWLSICSWIVWAIVAYSLFWEPLRRLRLRNALTKMRLESLQFAVVTGMPDERIRMMDVQAEFLIDLTSSLTITKLLIMYSNSPRAKQATVASHVANTGAANETKIESIILPETFLLLVRSIPYLLVSFGLGTVGGLVCLGFCRIVAGPAATGALLQRLAPAVESLLRGALQRPYPAI